MASALFFAFKLYLVVSGIACTLVVMGGCNVVDRRRAGGEA